MLEAIGQAAGDQDNDDERRRAGRLTPERRRVPSVQPAIERADKRSIHVTGWPIARASQSE